MKSWYLIVFAGIFNQWKDMLWCLVVPDDLDHGGSGDGSVHFQHRSSSKENAESSYAKSASTQVTSTHTENEHETWRYPLRKDTKHHLQTRAKPFLDCFQVGFLFKRVSTYLSESNPIVLQLVTVLRADLWQKIQDFSVRLRKRRFFVRL